MNIYILNIKNEISSNKYVNLLNCISTERREKIFKYKKQEDKVRSLFTEVLLRVMINRHSKLKDKEINFKYNKYGKPKLACNFGLEFNISHAGEFIVVVIDMYNVGVDIERCSKIDFLEIAKRFYTEEEYSYILNQEKKDQLYMFYKIWTLKESYVKFIGEGLSFPINTVSFKKDYYGRIALNNKDSDIRFYCYNIDKEYVLSLCTAYRKRELIIEYVDVDNLLGEFQTQQKNIK